MLSVVDKLATVTTTKAISQ